MEENPFHNMDSAHNQVMDLYSLLPLLIHDPHVAL